MGCCYVDMVNSFYSNDALKVLAGGCVMCYARGALVAGGTLPAAQVSRLCLLCNMSAEEWPVEYCLSTRLPFHADD